jgi:hypothetical protein
MKKNRTPETKAAVERILAKAADGLTWLDFGGPLEKLVCEVMSPACSPTQSNDDAFIRLISCLEEVAKVASVQDWDLVCAALKSHVYHWSHVGQKQSFDYIDALEVQTESEVSHA